MSKNFEERRNSPAVSNFSKICELYFDNGYNCTEIAKEINTSVQYISKILRTNPKYFDEKQRRIEINNKNYLDRKEMNRKKQKAIIKEDNTILYLRHLQWQHSIEMSKRYIV